MDNVVAVQLLTSVRLFVTPWTAAHSFPCHHFHKTTQIQIHWVSDVIEPSHSLLSPSPPESIFPGIRVFYNESALCIRWPKCWSFSFNISPSNEHPGLIYLRMDWLDLLAVQGTLKSLLQQHSSKASILRLSAFFIVQLSHLDMPLEKPYLNKTDLSWQSNVSAFEYAI